MEWDVHGDPVRWCHRGPYSRWADERSTVFHFHSIVYIANKFYHRFYSAWKINNLCVQCWEPVYYLKSKQFRKDISKNEKKFLEKKSWKYLISDRDCALSVEWLDLAHLWIVLWSIWLYNLWNTFEYSENTRCDFVFSPAQTGISRGMCSFGDASQWMYPMIFLHDPGYHLQLNCGKLPYTNLWHYICFQTAVFYSSTHRFLI